MKLDIGKTYQAILAAAREHRFVTYKELAEASGVEWNRAWRALPTQLGQLAAIAHERGWPLLSAIVVKQENIDTGKLDGDSLKGFLSAADMVGLEVADPESFVSDQQAQVFEWAKTAPEQLGQVTADAQGRAAGPRFVQYFAPVLDALRELGDGRSPEDVYSWIRDRVDVPEEELNGVTQGGQSKFENKVGWARFYLAKAGLVDGSKRGVWSLTAEGRETHLDHAGALQLFREVQARFKTSGDEEEPVPEPVTGHALFDDPERSFWFVGAAWGSDDQTERFLTEGIWQNGYDEKFSDHVARMKPGDKIAIKAAFVQKYQLPFDNHGKSVSCMRIKAVGTITENSGDRKTVKVDWERVDPPRDWFFYTYRVTVVEADRSDPLARRLILFTFAGAKQDYQFWLTEVPYFARKYGAPSGTKPLADDPLDIEEPETEEEAAAPTYTLDNIIAEGCFLPRDVLARVLARTESKMNLILQGPPGTGKTWLAKRLAYVLIGSKDPKVTRDRLRIVQFHPSLSYEDFVRGWRPSGSGTLQLIDGIFLESIQAAEAEPDRPFVLIIEEINRGNPAQIFGELLTLIEDSKRSVKKHEDGIELAYRRDQQERIVVPPNLYILGTMNIADRSLALVDLALRRRFAYVTLEPQLSDAWKEWCVDRCGMGSDDADLIRERMEALNGDISKDRSLGHQYRIGHSYVTPREGAAIGDARRWFAEVAETEIIPLLEEYWFDAPEKVESAARKLVEAL
ncbi:AAA family ATPase [Mesorhizobium sp.]|uniref:AAA family ATPase n=1 Tax=Mesorhizobium sp. TaxID=1871066 RepID=UPI0025F6CFE9|nr:AAA family ATPase [Mesorhizobium sp.]